MPVATNPRRCRTRGPRGVDQGKGDECPASKRRGVSRPVAKCAPASAAMPADAGGDLLFQHVVGVIYC
jgi:hypothetical protein